MERTALRRVIKGLGANAYSQVVTLIIQLLGVPILLHGWGPQQYGEWLILFAIPTYLSMADLGLSQSAGNDMSSRVSRHDRTGALAVYQSLVILVSAMALVGLLFISISLGLAPLQHWSRFEAIPSHSVRWILWIAGADILVGLLNGVTHAGFRASGDYALHVILSSTSRLMQSGSVWLVVLAGGGPLAAAGAFLTTRVVSIPAMALLLSYRHPWLRYGTTHASGGELKRLMRPALANLALPCAQAINLQGMILLVGTILGPLAVVAFSTLRTITRVALQMVHAVSHAAEPELAAAYGVSDSVLMRSIFLNALRTSLWLSMIAAGGLALSGGWIVKLWTHGQVTLIPNLFAWLLGSALATVLWYGALIVLRAANRHLEATVLFVLASGATLASTAALLAYTGELAYAGLSLLVTDGVMALYTWRAVARLLNISATNSLRRALNPLPLLRIAAAREEPH